MTKGYSFWGITVVLRDWKIKGSFLVKVWLFLIALKYFSNNTLNRFKPVYGVRNSSRQNKNHKLLKTRFLFNPISLNQLHEIKLFRIINPQSGTGSLGKQFLPLLTLKFHCPVIQRVENAIHPRQISPVDKC